MIKKIILYVFTLLTFSCKHPVESSELNIIKGQPVLEDNWLASVTVAITDDNDLRFRSNFCSGTVIAENAILTAGHCMDNSVTEVTEWIVWGPKISADSPKRKVIKKVRHPKYSKPLRDAKYKFNDLAVYFFEGELPANGKIARLVSPDITYNRNDEFLIAGFGVTSVHHDLPKDGLHGAVVNLRKQDRGKQELELVGLRGEDTCDCDSGGPAFVSFHGDMEVYLGGVTSWGENCGGSGHYVDLRYYQSAIDELLALGS